MRFQRADGGELRLAPATVDVMRTHVQRQRGSQEAGGILLGRLLLEGDHVVVEALTVPGPNDRRSRFHFFRAERPAQIAVNEAWVRSGGELNYLGEWHTHPEDDPSPSSHDRTDWRRLVLTQRYEQPSLFFIIVGRINIRAWELPRNTATALVLPMLDD